MSRINWTISIFLAGLFAALVVIVFVAGIDGLMTAISNWGMP